MSSFRDLLVFAAERAADHHEKVVGGPVFPDRIDLEAVRAALGALGPGPVPAAQVVEQLADAVEPALVGTTGPRYFGFVVGGALDAATAADILTTGWDQPAFNAVTSPAAAVVEEVAGTWLKELLGLPAAASFGFVTGGQAANTVSLAAARHHVLAQAGWDVEQQGLTGRTAGAGGGQRRTARHHRPGPAPAGSGRRRAGAGGHRRPGGHRRRRPRARPGAAGPPVPRSCASRPAT